MFEPSKEEFEQKYHELIVQLKVAFSLIYLNQSKVIMYYNFVVRSLTQALKAEGYVGAVFTQLTDVEAELNGFFSYNREVVKVDLQALAKMHAELIVE